MKTRSWLFWLGVFIANIALYSPAAFGYHFPDWVVFLGYGVSMLSAEHRLLTVYWLGQSALWFLVAESLPVAITFMTLTLLSAVCSFSASAPQPKTARR